MDLQQAPKNWKQRRFPENLSARHFQKIADDTGISETIARILALRGLIEKQEIAEFLAPSLSLMPRPHLMKGMEDAVALLLEAVQSNKPVTVFGDFDADGVTSTAVLSLFFSELGVHSRSYIPDRLTEGYGLNSRAIQKLSALNISEWGEAGVLITADCGISDIDAVAEAKNLGFTVIITDHHKPPAGLPEADAILNPLQPGCQFPCKNLAGVGVAFYLILGLRSGLMGNGRWPEDKIPNLKSYMDLVAIGTVADQVPVTGCNRVMVKAGLEVLNLAERVGLQKLLEISSSSLSEVSAQDIAFKMAPRINAAGRIGSAAKAVALLTTSFPDKAQKLAEDLDAANTARKSIEASIYEEAIGMASSLIPGNPNSLVLYKSDWHQGVLGIVASRLTDHFNLPAILLTDHADDCDTADKKSLKGSGRSIDGIDIHRAISECKELLERFGGHVGAVGLTLPEQELETFRSRFAEAVHNQLAAENSSLIPSLVIDGEISLPELTDPRFLESYGRMAPFGRGNLEPVFSLRRQRLVNLRQVGSNHLRFTVMDTEQSINGIGFHMGHNLSTARENLVDLAFTLRFNTFRGINTWEMQLVDLRLFQESAPDNNY